MAIRSETRVPTPPRFAVDLFLGTPYDWGKAQGQLLGEKAVRMMDAVWGYLEDQVVRVGRTCNAISYSYVPITMYL